MPRRKRIHIPGFLWHITHRWHNLKVTRKKEHLLKFEKDSKTWRDWLFKAKKRYGQRVITYFNQIGFYNNYLSESDPALSFDISLTGTSKAGCGYFAHAMLALSRHRDQRVRLRELSLEQAGRFSWQTSAARLLALYAEAVSLSKRYLGGGGLDRSGTDAMIEDE
ncbi:MAG: hypothetical protein U9P10_11530 [Thermodesulfobacteriota bacterium]|nr:hypothetical protein [Thermodesulfobacteriota bacterium]